MAQLTAGKRAPAFTLTDQHGDSDVDRFADPDTNVHRHSYEHSDRDSFPQ